MTRHKMDRAVEGEVIVDAPIERVWRAWTVAEEAQTFFAPKCAIDLRPGGKYEMLFDLKAAPGDQGGEGVVLLALQPPVMLSFSWNAPPELPDIRAQRTHVTVRLQSVEPDRTRVSLIHDGWGEGDGWDAAYDYFERAWKRVVLPRLKYRFEHGPINWNHPPDLNGFQPE
ncbi:MAG: SRPBCC domain-containing protein [Anaerolineales bacterium]|nr:SRPBCC domain-containing protein [Anaerolineales bacterium]